MLVDGFGGTPIGFRPTKLSDDWAWSSFEFDLEAGEPSISK